MIGDVTNIHVSTFISDVTSTQCWFINCYFRSVIGDVQNRLKSGGAGSGVEEQQQRFQDTKNVLATIHADIKAVLKSKVSVLHFCCFFSV